jgi:hypothetical protein
MNSTSKTQHGTIFSMLVVLALSAVGVTYLHLPVMSNNLAVFAVAFVMAALVFFQYMELKLEGKLIYWVMIIPCVLFVILVVLLIPDVCHFSVDFLKGL